MNPKRKLTCWKYSTVFGSLLAILPLGLFFYWGNMSIYSLSYIVNVVHRTSNVDVPWIISMFIAFQALGSTSVNFIATRIGLRFSVIAGAFLADIGLLCSYWAVQNSVLALIGTLSIVLGYGTGIVVGSTFQLVVEWADDDVGKLTTIIQSGFSFGGMLINEFVTLYANPRNLLPDIKLGRVKYFTQKEILDRVPSTYLVLGAFSFSLHMAALLMIRRKPRETTQTIPLLMLNQAKPCAETRERTGCEKEGHNRQNLANQNTNIISSKKQIATITATEPGRDEQSMQDYHPKEVLKSATFYVIWICSVLGSMPFLLLVNYYKSFGQIWIQDDHFITILGAVTNFVTTFTYILWGLAIDRFGVKKILVVTSSIVIITTSWYYFTPMSNPWLYFIVTLGIATTADQLFSCCTVAIAKLYGKTHYSTNFGLFMTSHIALNVIAPYILKVILIHFGWFAIFAFGAGFTLINLILILLFIPLI